MYASASHLHAIYVTLSLGTSLHCASFISFQKPLQQHGSDAADPLSQILITRMGTLVGIITKRHILQVQTASSPNAAAPSPLPPLAAAHQPTANQRQQLPTQALFQVM
jgi:hypothetical protein